LSEALADRQTLRRNEGASTGHVRKARRGNSCEIHSAVMTRHADEPAVMSQGNGPRHPPIIREQVKRIRPVPRRVRVDRMPEGP
jgi:hypothetical protein